VCLRKNIQPTKTVTHDKAQPSTIVRGGAPRWHTAVFRAQIKMQSWTPGGARHQHWLTDRQSAVRWHWLWTDAAKAKHTWQFVILPAKRTCRNCIPKDTKVTFAVWPIKANTCTPLPDCVPSSTFPQSSFWQQVPINAVFFKSRFNRRGLTPSVADSCCTVSGRESVTDSISDTNLKTSSRPPTCQHFR
jgi:hypothetical protein